MQPPDKNGEESFALVKEQDTDGSAILSVLFQTIISVPVLFAIASAFVGKLSLLWAFLMAPLVFFGLWEVAKRRQKRAASEGPQVLIGPKGLLLPEGELLFWGEVRHWKEEDANTEAPKLVLELGPTAVARLGEKKVEIPLARLGERGEAFQAYVATHFAAYRRARDLFLQALCLLRLARKPSSKAKGNNEVWQGFADAMVLKMHAGRPSSLYLQHDEQPQPPAFLDEEEARLLLSLLEEEGPGSVGFGLLEFLRKKRKKDAFHKLLQDFLKSASRQNREARLALLAQWCDALPPETLGTQPRTLLQQVFLAQTTPSALRLRILRNLLQAPSFPEQNAADWLTRLLGAGDVEVFQQTVDALLVEKDPKVAAFLTEHEQALAPVLLQEEPPGYLPGLDLLGQLATAPTLALLEAWQAKHQEGSWDTYIETWKKGQQDRSWSAYLHKGATLLEQLRHQLRTDKGGTLSLAEEAGEDGGLSLTASGEDGDLSLATSGEDGDLSLAQAEDEAHQHDSD